MDVLEISDVNSNVKITIRFDVISDMISVMLLRSHNQAFNVPLMTKNQNDTVDK